MLKATKEQVLNEMYAFIGNKCEGLTDPEKFELLLDLIQLLKDAVVQVTEREAE